MAGLFKISMILGSHAHVSSGAAETEFRAAYEKKLRPFVSNLCRYPKIQAALHYSGVLLYWVERNHPELFMLIEDLISRRQVEIIGGGFYEPMLPLIPVQDRLDQIELLTTYLRRHFGKRPLGCWIPALAWEQHLVSSLSSGGMGYTFLSEKQFQLAGLEGDDLYYPCISEDQGKLITVFPIAQSLESSLAEKNISLVLDELENSREGEREKIISIFPEKLASAEGEPPEYTWNRFFEELSLSNSRIEWLTPGKILKNLGGLKKASFPDSIALYGGEETLSPRRFIIEHPEANGIYAKMIFTNVLIKQLRGDKSRKQSAREELWKAQDRNLYCPSGKQGLYRNTLRKTAYHALLCAEGFTREKGKFSPSLVQYDFDLDGKNEYLFQDAKINCYIQSRGAGVFELDYLPKAWNYLDAGSEAAFRRTAFTDWLLPPGTKAENLLAPPSEAARRCRTLHYEASAQNRSKAKVCFVLPPQADVPLGAIKIEKCFSLKKDLLGVDYTLTNSGGENAVFCFAGEIYLSFAGEGEEFVRFFSVKGGAKDTPLTGGSAVSAEGLKIHDLKNEVQINLASACPFDLFVQPVYLRDESGAEYYQSHRITPLFAVSLAAGEKWNGGFNLKFSH
jgi:hypothetical protein